jgi:hypothetical protein
VADTIQRPRAAEQGRPDVAAARDIWRANQPKLNPARLVFIDETWATTNMTRRFGRCPRGQRLLAAVPHGHWKTSTFVAALRTSGLTVPLVIDGAMNGEVFRTYVEQLLAPTLAPGDIVIMDNLGSHKVAGVREAIEADGLASGWRRGDVLPAAVPSEAAPPVWRASSVARQMEIVLQAETDHCG